MARHLPLALAMLLTFLPGPVFPQSRGPAPGSVLRYPVTSGARIGVIGAVVEPGVYPTDDSTPRLVDVIGRAGGLADEATGNVRIVRNGRAGQQTFYSPRIDFRLANGDLLVVDAYPPSRSRALTSDAPTVDDVDEPIQLAFLHVLDRPVVLRMRPEQATLERIVRFLGQSNDVLAGVRVIETGPRYTRGARNAATRLAEGSVLVFDAGSIDVERLPELPGLVATAGAVADQPAPSRSPVLDAPARLVGTPSDDLPASTASLTRPIPDSPLPLEETGDERTESRPLLTGPSFGGPSFGTIDKPTTRDPAESDSSFLDSRPGESSEPVTAENDDDRDLASVLPGLPDDESLPGTGTGAEAVESPAPRADGGSFLIVLGVLALAGVLIWFLGRRAPPVSSEWELEETTGESPAEPPVGSTIESTVESTVASAAMETPTVTAPSVEQIERMVAVAAAPVEVESVIEESTPAVEPVREPVAVAVAESETPSAMESDSLPVPVSVRRRPRTALDDLIEGITDLEEEPVELPEAMQLHGRSPSERTYRVDSGEVAEQEAPTGEPSSDTATPRRSGPRRPHFLAGTTGGTGSEAEVVAGESQQVDTGRRIDAGGDHESKPRSRMLERVLATVHGAER